MLFANHSRATLVSNFFCGYYDQTVAGCFQRGLLDVTKGSDGTFSNTKARGTKDRRACPPTNPPLDDYRKWLIQAEHKAQDDFDKTVIALSGGALGISFAFVKDIVGPGQIHYSGFLVGAWIAWALSLLGVLFSFWTSHMALRVSIKQCDDGTIYRDTPGGRYSNWTKSLNLCGAIALCIGVLLMAAFVYTNIAARTTNGNEHRESAAAASERPPHP